MLKANLYVVNTTVSSALASSDQTFARYNILGSSGYYYHVYSLIVPVTGYYVIMTTNATTDFYGFIYFPGFDASIPSQSLRALDDNSGGNLQFQIIMNLQANYTYFVVVTTTFRNRTGPYTLTVSGLYAVNLNQVTNTTNNTTASTITSPSSGSTSVGSTNGVTTSGASTVGGSTSGVTTSGTSTVGGSASAGSTAGSVTPSASDDDRQTVIIVVVAVVVGVLVLVLIVLALQRW